MSDTTIRVLDNSDQQSISTLFSSVFRYAEGEKEGQLLGNLTAELGANIDDKEIVCFGSFAGEILIGSIFFTRLSFRQSITVFMLAPVAVRTENQGQGVGQTLINHGLNAMKCRSVEVVVTYGDPDYYSKLDFKPLSESTIQAPLDLSMPFGWQGISLTNDPIPVIEERPSCVKEFNDPVYW